MNAQQHDRILLSVGGAPFEASRRVLTAEPASFLGAMFSGSMIFEIAFWCARWAEPLMSDIIHHVLCLAISSQNQTHGSFGVADETEYRICSGSADQTVPLDHGT